MVKATVTFRVSPNDRDRLKILSERDGVSEADLLRQAIHEGLSNWSAQSRQKLMEQLRALPIEEQVSIVKELNIEPGKM